MKKLLLLAIFISSFTLSKSQDFEWARHFGESEGTEILTDIQGNVYIGGYFNDTNDVDPGPATYNLISNGNVDLYLTKLDSSGNFIWGKQIGGAGSDILQGITVDSTGNIYWTGCFYETIDIDPGIGVYTFTTGTTSTTIGNTFFLKLDSAGELVWAKQLGNSTTSVAAYSIKLGISKNIFLSGTFSTTTDFDPGSGIFNLSPAGLTDGFIAKYDSLGNFIWAKKLGGSGNDECNTIFLDGSENLLSTGTFETIVDFDPGVGIFNLSSSGAADIFFLKLDSLGNFLWAKKTGGTNTDWQFSSAVDNSGNIYATGQYTGTVDFDPGPATYNFTTPVGSWNSYIQKLNQYGDFVWAKKVGIGLPYFSTGIAVDTSQNVYMTGCFQATCDFDPGPGIYNFTAPYYYDGYVYKLNSSGNFLWARQVRSIGASSALGRYLTVDKQNNIYSIGKYTGLIDFDGSSAIYNMSNYGHHGYTTYILKMRDSICSDTTLDISTSLIGNTIIANQNGAIYQWLNCDQGYAPISGETQQSFTPLTDGNYAVYISNDCYSNTSACVQILTTELNEWSNNATFSIYPNPSKNNFSVNTSKPTELSISNILGESVLKIKVENKTTVDISQLNNGVYFIRNTEGNTIKLIKQ